MKPDDVPQWAWDQAKTKDGFDYKQDVKIVVARAIVQARSQAFEECAKIAEEFPGDADPYSDFDDGVNHASMEISHSHPPAFPEGEKQVIGDRTKDQSPSGYVLEFACTYGGGYPPDLQWGDDWDGWQIRSAIVKFCDKAGIKDYKIVRNTSYVKDLHGSRVYELYSKALSSQPQKGEQP